MYMLLLFILTFHAGSFMIDLNRLEDGTAGDTDPDYLYQSGLLNMYLVVIGDYPSDFTAGFLNSERSDNLVTLVENILYIFFFMCATFVTQITILNMLIAIMGATYTKHSENMDEGVKR